MKNSSPDRFIRNAWLAALVLALPLCTAASVAADSPQVQAQPIPPYRHGTPTLTEIVRHSTARFTDVTEALNEGWTAKGQYCVSGPETGAMGVHFVNADLVGDGTLDPHTPEALIYEPMPNGAMRLVGVEFIVLAADWRTQHPDGSTPQLEGNLLNFVGEPNRYGLPAFYELHVWAWEDNPHGTFADWNTHVSCIHQSDK